MLLKGQTNTNEKKQKIVKIVLILLASVLAASVLLGVGNALFADGEWSYRYEEKDYQVGSSTIPTEELTSLDLDWIDGTVQIVACQDVYPSVVESADGELSENAQLRWSMSEDGSSVSIKYRKSSAFLGLSGGKEGKNVVLRIPERCFDTLKTVSVTVRSSQVTVEGIEAEKLSLTTKSGSASVVGGTYKDLSATTISGSFTVDASISSSILMTSRGGDLTLSNALNAETVSMKTVKGNVKITLPEDAGFRLSLQSDEKKFSCNRDLTRDGKDYLCGNGSAKLTLASEKGAVRVFVREKS